MGDLQWNDEVIKYQRYQELSEELKNAPSLHGSQYGNLESFIANSKILDNRVGARNEERKTIELQNQFSAFQPHNQNIR